MLVNDGYQCNYGGNAMIPKIMNLCQFENHDLILFNVEVDKIIGT